MSRILKQGKTTMRAMIAGLGLLLLAPSAQAEFPKTDADFALLPPYCKAKMRTERKSPQWSMWNRRLAGGFTHIHHYCAALHTLNQANRISNPQRKKELMRSALKNFEYVETHADEDFILRPEISVKKGKLLIRMGRANEALNAFQDAIRRKPNYSPAYMALADFYESVGDKDKALAVVREGLAKAPNSRGLRRRLRELQ
ncbi:tetratricopeptide repeat protein [Thiohalobacter sp.]|uniref:tetratricopeptide repeat protein n=1 Tax=Thiohalobacter sp. TaxID=2025948 RepID=UPI0026367261|nr:tetratricopeptide repeat protein [Thiohalobacter sp.]